MLVSLADIAELVGGQLVGDSKRQIDGLAPLPLATKPKISFLSDRKLRKELAKTQAGAVLLKPEDAESCSVDHIMVEDPYLAFAKVSHLFDPEPRPSANIHPSAVIAADVSLGDGVAIGPGAVVESGCVLGDGVIIQANSVVGEQCRIGARSRLYPNVTLYHGVTLGEDCLIHSGTVIGSHGFGYANSQGNWHKIAQIGGVRIGNAVEIAANCAIDRGALGDTVIADGVKLDNLVHVAHNVEIGAHTALAGQIGISGSTKIGAYNMAGGQCGFAGHIETSDGCIFTGQAMVTKSIKEPGMYSSGVPAIGNKEWRKMTVRMRQLEDMAARLKHLEKQLENND